MCVAECALQNILHGIYYAACTARLVLRGMYCDACNAQYILSAMWDVLREMWCTERVTPNKRVEGRPTVTFQVARSAKSAHRVSYSEYPIEGP